MDKMSCLLNPLAWKVSLIPCNQHLPKWVPQTHEKGYLLLFFYGDKGNEENGMSNIVICFLIETCLHETFNDIKGIEFY